MLNDEQITELAYYISDRFSNLNITVLEKIGQKIAEIEKMTPSDVLKIQNMYNYGADIKEITRVIQTQTAKSAEEIATMFTEVAKGNYEFATPAYNDLGIEQISFAQNKKLQNLVATLAKQTFNTLENISNTKAIGLVVDGKVQPFEKAYKSIIDKAILTKKTTGADFYTTYRQTMNEIGTNGMVLYESNVQRRVDTAVRYNILDASHKLNQESQNIIGEEIGADGVEISAHSSCAEDHLMIQARVYTNEEFEKVNSRLDRKIGEHNCRHFIFRVNLDVNKPVYTEKERQQLIKKNQKLIDIDGQKKTIYEWQQEQNKLGLQIRKDKERIALFKSLGDTEQVSKLTALKNKHLSAYNNLSSQADLPKKRWQTTPNYRKY